MNEVTKTFRYTYFTIFTAKIRNFLKKSIWLYLIASALISFGYWGLSVNALLFGLAIFGLLIVISLTAVIISTSVMYQRKKLDNMVISFRETEIEVIWENKKLQEIKNWDWVKKVEDRNDVYYLDLAVWPKNTLMINKSQLSAAEAEFLIHLFQSHQKLG